MVGVDSGAPSGTLREKYWVALGAGVAAAVEVDGV